MPRCSLCFISFPIIVFGGQLRHKVPWQTPPPNACVRPANAHIYSHYMAKFANIRGKALVNFSGPCLDLPKLESVWSEIGFQSAGVHQKPPIIKWNITRCSSFLSMTLKVNGQLDCFDFNLTRFFFWQFPISNGIHSQWWRSSVTIKFVFFVRVRKEV